MAGQLLNNNPDFGSASEPEPLKNDRPAPRVVMTFQYLQGVGGAQLQAFRLASMLRKHGCQVSILGTAASGNIRSHLAQYGLDSSLTIHVIKPVSLPEKWPKLLRSYLEFTHYTLKALYWLYANRDVYDIVHGHMLHQTGIICGLNSRLWRKPSLVKLASGGEFGDVRKVQQSPLWPLRRKAHDAIGKFICLTQEIYDEAYNTLRIPQERLEKIPNGVDADLFSLPTLQDRVQARQELAISQEKYVVLYVGRIAQKKRVDFLLAAWAILQKKTEGDLSLLLVGGGEQQELISLARQLGVEDTVQFCGQTENVLAYLHAADSFILPSVSEGLANVLLEAMAAGLPCIVTATAGNEDVITDGINGLTFIYDSQEALADCIERIINDVAAANRLGQAARDTVEQKFSLQAVAWQYQQIYHELLKANDFSHRIFS